MSPGEAASRYRIAGPLGRGGMGVVYRAEDTVLGREVALKFLPSESMEDDDRARFLNEARAAARIRHPNVCPIFDIDEADGRVFIVMALVEGETLARRIARGPLNCGDAMDIAIQAADGLDSAHRAGIVHRDIKSGNIMIGSDGHVTILDFGLALSAETIRVTAEGRTSGTPAYMSPQQACGMDLDGRTDIWSLGVLLFEMITGVLPFRRGGAAAVTHSIVYDEAPSVSALRPGVPAELERAIGKAMAKRVEDRWQTAAEFASELRRIRGTLDGMAAMSTQTLVAAPPVHRSRRRVWIAAAACVLLAGGAAWWKFGPRTEPKQLAILPFSVEGGADITRAVADGLLEVITESLSETQRSKGKFLPVPAAEIRRREIASPAEARRVYGVDYAMTGSARPAGATLHIGLSLVDAVSGRALGKAEFDYDPAAPRASKDRAVAEALRLLAPESAAAVRPEPSDSASPDAYSAYLEGRGLLSRYNVRGNSERAIAVFSRATALDPKFALAWSGLAEASWRKARTDGDKAAADRALECAERAVRLDPTLAIARSVLGAIYGTAGRNEEAIRELRKALELAPGNAEAPRELARIYAAMGRVKEAEASYLQATHARPTDWYAHLLLGLFYSERERYREAESAYRRALQLAPDNEIAARNLANLFMRQGKYAEGVQVLQHSLKVRSNARTYLTLGAIYFYQHRYQEAASALETAIDIDSGRHDYWGNLGIYYKWIPGASGKAEPALLRAAELAEKKLEATPAADEVRADLAEYRARLGDAKGAMAEVEKIPAAKRQGLASRLALAYELTGNRARAIELIRSTLTHPASLNAIKDDPDLAGLWADPAFQKSIEPLRRR